MNNFLIQHAGHGFDIGRMITSSLVHGLIYGVIFKAFHALSLPVVVLIAVIGVVLLFLIFKRR
jgi:hypothetical protein